MWYTGATETNARIYYATSPDGLTWTKYNNTIPANSDTTSTEGRIPLGTSGKGDANNVIAPAVIKDGSTYKMWYSGGGSYRIYYATSPDGLTWTKYNNAIPANSDTTSTDGRIPLGTSGKGDDGTASVAVVIKDGSTYKMWYAGYDGSNIYNFYATSPDGLTWTKYNNTIPANSDTTSTDGRIPLGTAGKADADRSTYPAVIKDGLIYRMWYSAYNGGNRRILYATSPDGLTWTKYNNSIPPTSDTTGTQGRIPIGTSGKGDAVGAYRQTNAIKEGSTYKIWYTGAEGGAGINIYYATLETGITANESLPEGWNQITATIGSGNLTLYVNGNQVATGTTPVTWTNNTEKVILGNYFNGSIDELAMWNRALSATEISNIYNYSKTKYYPVFQNKTGTDGSTYQWNVLACDNTNQCSYANNFTFQVNFASSNCGSSTSTTTCAPWWNQSFPSRIKLTINNTAQSENLVDFPVLVVLSSSRIDYTKTQNNGEDIRFTDSDGSTLLQHEIELWNESGNSFVWVKTPQIDSSSSKDFIYLYFNNATVADGQNKTGVWDHHYMIVQHLQEGDSNASNFYKDSTNNSNDGTLNDTDGDTNATGGQIDGAIDFSGDADVINIDDPSNLLDLFRAGGSGVMTLTAWTKRSTTGTHHVIAQKGLDGVEGWVLTIDSGNLIEFEAPGAATYDSTGTIDTNWHHIALVYNSSFDVSFYIDGIFDSDATGASAGTTSSVDFRIGLRNDNVQPFNGIIDEFRISNTTRSAAWINASYKTQTDTYLTYESEESYNSGIMCLDYIDDSNNQSLLIIDSAGNADVYGSFNESATVQPNAGFTVVNSSGTVVASLNKTTGDFIILGSIMDGQGGTCTEPSEGLIVRNGSGNCVAYIDNSGNMWLRGELCYNSNI